MRNFFFLLAVLCCTRSAIADVNNDLGPNVIEADRDHTVTRYYTLRTNENNEVVQDAHRFVSLATGMNIRQENGSFVPATPAIEIQANGAAALGARHKVTFLPNITDTNGAIDLLADDDKNFRSRPLCISYYDPQTGNSVLIAELKDSVGELIPGENQIVYADCFTDFKCDLLFQNRLSGFEQNLVLRERPPAPSEFGMNNQTARLQLLTEFFGPPCPTKVTEQHGGLTCDAFLKFGAMSIGKGKAFLTSNQGPSSKQIPVQKHWQQLEGRDFLIEEIDYKSFAAQLAELPEHPVALNGAVKKNVASTKRVLPKVTARAETGKETMRVAKFKTQTPGFVLDYSIVSSVTNFTFRGDTTYYVTNNISLDGTTTIEGGTVVKFASNVVLQINGAIQCLTEAYRPAVFTAKDDDSVGEAITGSTGNPIGYYAGCAINVVNTNSTNNLKYLRIGHASNGLILDMGLNPYQPRVSHCQFVNCDMAMQGLSIPINVENTLFHKVNTCFLQYASTVRASHLTVHECNKLGDFVDFDDSSYFFTNCLFSALTNINVGAVSLVNSVTNVPTNSFATVGAGAHYLVEDSVYRNAGTTNINSALANELKRKTTYAPVVLRDVTLSVDTELNPILERDFNIPDLGYHYDALDYVINAVAVTNATLTIGNGCDVGTFGENGLILRPGGYVQCEGTPSLRNHIARYTTVQELSTNWEGATFFTSVLSSTYSAKPSAAFRFTDFDMINGSGYHFYADEGFAFTNLTIKDCDFNSGNFMMGGIGSSIVNITNNCFERTSMMFLGYPTLNFFNNHVKSFRSAGSIHDYFYLERYGGGTWAFRNNLFDSCLFDNEGDTITHSHNAYLNCDNQLDPPNVSDITLSSFTFTNGPLGNFYQVSTNLINAGSQNATNAGLYHYTTQQSQVKETNTVVDIGLHYVAADGNGQPLDADSDGVPDFVEDANGNGVVNSGETDPQSATDVGLRIRITQPKASSNIP